MSDTPKKKVKVIASCPLHEDQDGIEPLAKHAAVWELTSEIRELEQFMGYYQNKILAKKLAIEELMSNLDVNHVALVSPPPTNCEAIHVVPGSTPSAPAKPTVKERVAKLLAEVKTRRNSDGSASASQTILLAMHSLGHEPFTTDKVVDLAVAHDSCLAGTSRDAMRPVVNQVLAKWTCQNILKRLSPGAYEFNLPAAEPVPATLGAVPPIHVPRDGEVVGGPTVDEMLEEVLAEVKPGESFYPSDLRAMAVKKHPTLEHRIKAGVHTTFQEFKAKDRFVQTPIGSYRLRVPEDGPPLAA
jgi:hypothetical protein